MDEDKITIAVCGESYCSAMIVNLKETGLRGHFSQILEDQYGYKILHFAHGGFSNTGILFQMQEAVKHQPNVVVYNKTWNSRITIKVNEHLRPFWPDDGLKNFVYFDNHMPSTHMPWTGNLESPILSTVIQGLEHQSCVTGEKLNAVKQYVTELLEYDLQTTLDNWLFDYWHNKIIAAGMLPLCFNDADIGKVAYDFSKNHPTIDSPFHTDRATQEQVAANIHRKIVDNLSQTK
jgi:hypothetical protein